MSRTFSTKKGSDDSLKASVRWGCNPKARQIRLTVLWLRPTASGHGAGAPVGGILGRGLQRQCNHPFHVVIGNRSGPTAAGFVRQPVQSPFHKPRPPLSHRFVRHPQFGTHCGVAPALGARQNHPGSQRQGLGRLGPRTHRSSVSRSASDKISAGMGRPIVMVILLWAPRPENTPSPTLLLLTSVT